MKGVGNLQFALSRSQVIALLNCKRIINAYGLPMSFKSQYNVIGFPSNSISIHVADEYPSLLIALGIFLKVTILS